MGSSPGPQRGGRAGQPRPGWRRGLLAFQAVNTWRQCSGGTPGLFASMWPRLHDKRVIVMFPASRFLSEINNSHKALSSIAWHTRGAEFITLITIIWGTISGLARRLSKEVSPAFSGRAHVVWGKITGPRLQTDAIWGFFVFAVRRLNLRRTWGSWKSVLPVLVIVFIIIITIINDTIYCPPLWARHFICILSNPTTTIQGRGLTSVLP